MTHPEITSPHLRAVLANELLVLRASMRAINEPLTGDYAYGVRTGLDTFARRLQDIERRGLELVYRQNRGKGANNETSANE